MRKKGTEEEKFPGIEFLKKRDAFSIYLLITVVIIMVVSKTAPHREIRILSSVAAESMALNLELLRVSSSLCRRDKKSLLGLLIHLF